MTVDPEDCLTENIKQNKVEWSCGEFYRCRLADWESDRRNGANLAERGEEAVPQSVKVNKNNRDIFTF